MRRTAAVTRALVVGLALCVGMTLAVPAAPASAAWRDTVTPLADQTLATGEARVRADTALEWRRIADDAPWGGEVPAELEVFTPENHRLHPGDRIRARIPVSALASGTSMQPRLTLSGADVPPSSESLSGQVSVASTEVAFDPDDAWQGFHIDLTVSVADDAGAGQDEFGGHLDLTAAAVRLLTGRTWSDEALVEGLGVIEIGRDDDAEVPDPDHPFPAQCPIDWGEANVVLAGSEPEEGWDDYLGWQLCLPIGDLAVPDDTWSFIVSMPVWLYSRTGTPVHGIMFIPEESEPTGVLNSAWSTDLTPVGDDVFATTMSLSFSSEFIRDVVEGRSDGRFLVALRDTGIDEEPYTFFLHGRLVPVESTEPTPGGNGSGDPARDAADVPRDVADDAPGDPTDDAGQVAGDDALDGLSGNAPGDLTDEAVDGAGEDAPEGSAGDAGDDAVAPDDGQPPPRQPDDDTAALDGDPNAPEAGDPNDTDRQEADEHVDVGDR